MEIRNAHSILQSHGHRIAQNMFKRLIFQWKRVTFHRHCHFMIYICVGRDNALKYAQVKIFIDVHTFLCFVCNKKSLCIYLFDKRILVRSYLSIIRPYLDREALNANLFW